VTIVVVVVLEMAIVSGRSVTKKNFDQNEKEKKIGKKPETLKPKNRKT
jgi:hypothetical protein